MHNIHSCDRNSAVECSVPNRDVVGSIPTGRSGRRGRGVTVAPLASNQIVRVRIPSPALVYLNNVSWYDAVLKRDVTLSGGSSHGIR